MTDEATAAPSDAGSPPAASAPDSGSSVRDDSLINAAVRENTDAPAHNDGSIRAQLTHAMHKTREPPAEKREPVGPVPQHWPQADRELFAKQAPEIQKWLLDRHNSMETDYGKKAETVAPLLKIVDLGKDYFMRSAGVTPTQGIQNLINAEYTLRHGTPQEKAAVMQEIIKTYNPPLPGSTSQATETPPADEWEDPAVSALRKDVARLRAAEEGRQRVWAAEQQAHVDSQVTAFETEKDATGKLAHPHFKTVLEDMRRAEQIARAQGRHPTLSELYESAIWTNPTIRAQLLAEQQAERQRKIETEAKARTRRQPVTAAPAGSIRGALQAALARRQ